MRNAQIQILNAADTASQTGGAYWVGQTIAASFAPVFGDTTAAGTLKIQCSNDIPVGSQPSWVPTNWCDIPNATSTITAGVGPAILIPNMAFAYVRAVYTRTSGGSTTVVVNMNILSA